MVSFFLSVRFFSMDFAVSGGKNELRSLCQGNRSKMIFRLYEVKRKNEMKVGKIIALS